MNNESRPSQERLSSPRAVRIETETSMIHGSLFLDEGNMRTIAVMGNETEGPQDKYLLRFGVDSLAVDKPFDFEYSVDGGESWQSKTSESSLKTVKAWERASEVTALDDLIAQTVVAESLENIDDQPYKQYPEYSYAEEAVQYAREHPEDTKITAGFNPNTGWKIHFSPNLENVAEISNYLKENGYYHKYLSGGWPSEGKAFTVYLGSRQMMEKWTTELERDFSGKLLPALAENEETVTPHISARFTSVDKDETGQNLFHQYGVHGMSACYATIAKRAKERLPYPTGEEAVGIATEAYDELTKRYGSYFHG